MNWLGRLHGGLVHSRRVEVLASHLAARLPRNAVALDVGCGDGLLAHRLAKMRPDASVSGIDIQSRVSPHVDIQLFDGSRIPRDAHSCDVVLFVDVLHHASDPLALMQEALRVTRQVIIIKDHVAETAVDRATLRLMDWAGNSPHGVAIPGNYWSVSQWDHAFVQLGASVKERVTSLGLYPLVVRPLFERTLHFMAVIEPTR